MEFVGHDPTWIYGTLHWSNRGEHASSGGKMEVPHLGEAFHVYAVNWDPARIEFFIDDRRYHAVDLARADQGTYNAFHLPHYVILNLALGGNWGGRIDDAILPQRMEVDYVRVYKKK